MKLTANGINRRFFRETQSSNVFYAVNTTDFTLQEGALTLILGRSGSGKSTLLNMLGGLLAPTQGKVLWDDADVYALSDAERSRLRNRYVSVVPQGQTGLQSLDVLQNVLLPTMLYEKGEVKPTEAEAMALLERVGISNLAGAFPNELSGGELRRMAIARALITKPQAILADEPTGDLDEENTHVVLGLLQETAASGTSVLMVTHDRDALPYADVIYRMSGGVLSVFDK